MLLDDHARGAGREGVAARGEIGAGDRLGDRAGDRARARRRPAGRGCCRSAPRGTGRRGLAPFIANTASTLPTRSTTAKVAGQAARLRLGDALGDDLLHLGGGQRDLRRDRRTGGSAPARRRARAAAAAAPPPPPPPPHEASEQGGDGDAGRGTLHALHLSLRIAAAARPRLARKSPRIVGIGIAHRAIGAVDVGADRWSPRRR